METADWSDAENDLIVSDYFAMLAEDIARRSYNKAEHRRVLRAELRARSDGSMEFKHQNISAVLKGLGETWITGYKPAFNFQSSLEDAVLRWLDRNRAWLERAPASPAANMLQDAGQLWLRPPPTLSNTPPPKELEQMLRIARKYDVAGRDARNRALGRDDLARAVRWVSEEDGDGAGHDIASFTTEGSTRLIEVKTTNGWERTPFHISRNELAVAEERRADWNLFRLWNFAREPQAFELHPPLEAHVTLTATTFQASFH